MGGNTRRDTELETLYRRNFASFVRVASAIAGSLELGREAVQDAFARAIESQAAFRGEGTLEAWVWRIVVNTARSSRRAARPESRLEELETAVPNGDGESSPLRLWVRSLPERQRLIVFLRYWADLDYRSIASVLDVEVGTVSATLNAAHRALRRSLEEASP